MRVRTMLRAAGLVPAVAAAVAIYGSPAVAAPAASVPTATVPQAPVVRDPVRPAPVPAAAPTGDPSVVAELPDLQSAARRAAAQGHRVRVSASGTSRSRTYANPDGTLTIESYAAPSFHRSGADRRGATWVPLSGAVTGAGTAADPLRVPDLARPVTLGRSAAQLVEIATPGGTVTLGAAGLRLGAPARAGATTTYAGVATDTDLQLVTSPSGVKTNLVLRSARAPRSYRFHLADPMATLGSVRERADGSWLFSGALGDGYQLALAPAASYELGRPDGTPPASATQSVIRASDGWDVTLAVDPAWLAGRAYPVVLDPSPVFVAGGPGTDGVDCGLASGTSANNNYCPAATRDIGVEGGIVRRTVVMFPVGSIPPNAQVSAAELDLYLATTSSTSGPIDVRAHRMTSGWNQGATWNTNGGGTSWTGGAPFDPASQTTTSVDTAAGHKRWALPSQLVTDWRDNVYGNYGLVLKAVNEGGGGTLRFASAFAADSSQRPRLTVTYTDPAALQADRTDSYAPILSGLVSGSGSYTTTFTITPPAGLGSAYARTATNSPVAAGSRARWAFGDAEQLVAGRTYSWTMKTCQGSTCSTSTTQSFTVDPRIAAGDRGFFTYRDWKLTDRLTLRVNAASGNLAAEMTDLSVPGITGDVTLGRTYNSLAVTPGLPNPSSSAGTGWQASVGTDTDVELNRDGSATVRTPSGYAALFVPVGVNWKGPQGVDATLSRVDGGWKFTEHRTGSVWAYDGSGRLTSVKDRSGNATVVRRDTTGNVSAVDGSRGPNDPTAGQSARRVVVNDGVSPSTSALRNYKQLPNPGSPLAARTVAFGYNGSDLRTVTDANGRTTTFDYDTSHRLTAVTTPSDANTVAHKTVITYEPGGYRVASVRQETTGAGVGPLTVFSYDDVNTRTTVTPPNVNAAGNPQRNQTYDWDHRHRVTTLANGFGENVSTTGFTGDSQVETSGNASGNLTTNSYATENPEQLTRTTSTTGPTTDFADYGSAGTATEFLPGSSTDGANDKSTYRYDGAGNLSGNTDAGGSEAVVERNPDGTVKFTTDPNNVTKGTSQPAPACKRGSVIDNCTLYTYTSSQLTGIRPPDGSGLNSRSYTYDGFNRLATASNKTGETVTYTYDALDRITKADSSRTADTDVTYTFDADGNQVQRADQTGTVTYRYDKLNRLTLKDLTGAATSCPGSSDNQLCYGWDDASNLVSLRDGRGTTTYHYSPISLLDEVNEHTGRTIVMAYDKDQRRVRTWFGTDIPANGTVYTATDQLTPPSTWVLSTKDTLDAAGRLTRTQSWNGAEDSAHRVGDLSYTYLQVALPAQCATLNASTGRGVGSDAGRKTQRINNMIGQTINYCYDKGGRLLMRIGAGSATYQYGYDKSGNRTSDVAGSTSTSYTYNSGNLTTTSGFSYDGAGNQKTGAPFASTASVYNGFDQATSVTPSGGSTTALAAAGTTNTELRTQGSTTLTQGIPGEQVLSTGGSPLYVQRSPDGGLLALVVGAGSTATNEYYYVLDGQGSVTNLVDATGVERAQYGYDPYGGHDSAVAPTGTLPPNPYRYDGGRAVAVNASNQVLLYQFGERFYSPSTGRWTQQDNLEHLGDPAQGNRYSYVGNDPVNNTDPTGRDAFSDGFLLGVGSAITIAGLFAPIAVPAAIIGIGLATLVYACNYWDCDGEYYTNDD
jgi:RHS repeat-associated protein